MRITFDHEMKNVDIRVLLQVAYHASPKFLEIDIDIGSSTVANNIVRFVLGYVRTLVVDMCFLIEGKNDDELPVRLT